MYLYLHYFTTWCGTAHSVLLQNICTSFCAVDCSGMLCTVWPGHTQMVCQEQCYVNGVVATWPLAPVCLQLLFGSF